MVIDFVNYVKMKEAQKAAEEAARLAEVLRRERLELFLSDTLAELLAA